VAEVDQPIDRQAQALGAAELGHPLLAAVQRASPRAEACGVAAVEIDQRTAVAAREQQARFLEALADRGDVVVEAALRQAEAAARLAVVEAGAGGVREGIGLLDDTARKHPGAAVVVAALGPAREQEFDPRAAVANDHQGRGGARRPVRAGARLRRRKGGSIDGR
jgi:hypothetical protein